MRELILALVLSTVALPAVAQSPEPPPTPPPPQEKPKPSFKQRLFFGGGIGASFGTVDDVAVAPMVGFRVVPRLELGFQPFYRWTDDGRYSPSISTSDYGARVFARVPVWRGLFAEADYEYTNYEYPTAPGTTARDSYHAFLVGGGYFFGFGGNVGMYASALYDLNYDNNDPIRAYDSAIRYQLGVSVGF